MVRTLVGLIAALLLAPCACTRDRARPSPSPAATAALGPSSTSSTSTPPVARHLTHGLWVWKTAALLDESSGAATLVDASRAMDVNELYVAVTLAWLDDARVPAFVGGLRAAGLRVEALMGDAVWYQPAKRAHMLTLIDAVAAYNARNREARFDAIHLDVEPHQLAINQGPDNRAYLSDFIACLHVARERAASAGMSVSADVPRKVLSGSAAERRALAEAVPRLFLMLYELRNRDAASAHAELARTSASAVRAAYEGSDASVGTMIVGLSVRDYGERLPEMLRAIDEANGADARYGGWAIHDDAQYRVLLREHPSIRSR
jgi:hypothetical protein